MPSTFFVYDINYTCLIPGLSALRKLDEPPSGVSFELHPRIIY